MNRRIEFEEIPEGEQQERGAAAFLHVNPPLDTALIERIKAIKGVGWVDDGVDFAAVGMVLPNRVHLESGCSVWCEHMQRLVYDIVNVVRESGEVSYIDGPDIRQPFLR